MRRGSTSPRCGDSDASDLEPCVLISGCVVEFLRAGSAPVCRFATKLIGPGAVSYIEGDLLRIDAREESLVYRLYEAEWADGHRQLEQLWLGVLQSA